MWNKHYIVSFFCFLIYSLGFSQDCSLNVEGKVIDKAIDAPLSYVTVTIQELSTGTITDDNGHFALNGICAGEYHLIISHIGCQSQRIHLSLYQDTLLNLYLEHTPISLEGVVVQGKSNSANNQASTSVEVQTIEDNLDKSLSALLENETGVHLIKNGSGIAKPVVHGMYGNRLTILNNGVPQSGQQWGNDHSPEIDPLIANRITVIKGTNVLEYGGGNLGSIILVEPQKIGREPHTHGRLGYSYETNGRGHNTNVQIQKYDERLAWRINGTYKKYGDRQSPRYFLKNTGVQEANFAIQLEKSWNDKYFIDFYASTFNTELGVLRGSHIGNLTDLELALVRSVPFYTEPDFSYALEAPKQKVAHHLVKLSGKYFIDHHQFLQIILASQVNNRKEFDVRRGMRTSIPAMSIEQLTYSADLKYQRESDNYWTLKIGAQTIFSDNFNNPETGILPLIPDYSSFKSGLFSTLNKEWGDFSFNTGIRYDNELQYAATISRSIPREIIRYQNNFHNLSGLLGFRYDIAKNQSIALNTGYAMRNPAINELYSIGLHQGVSGIEEGDINLQTEKSLKTTLDYKLQLGSKISFESLFYFQRFNDYIFLNPQEEFRLTVRGAFPVFKYEQTNADIYGLDLSAQFSIGKSWIAKLNYSYIRGKDITQKIPLVYIPPVNLNANLGYRVNKAVRLGKIKIEDLEWNLSNRLVLEQSNLLLEQDFVPPPATYNLLGVKAAANIILPKYKLRFFIKMDNALNTEYRDYLNRQRYFADDLGRSITLGINFKF